MTGSVGPGWTLVIVAAIMFLLPQWGLGALLVRVIKEDRQDKRKMDLENRKLVARYEGRAKKASAIAGKGKITRATKEEIDG